MKYPQEKIRKIQHCILTHSSDKKYKPKTLEAKIVASADALTHFDNILAISYYCFKKGLSLDEAKEKILRKANNSYEKMMPQAKIIAKPKYDAIKLLIEKN